MTTESLVNKLRERGFTLIVAGGSLRVSPASALTPADREAIRAALPALLTHLAPAAVTGIPDPCERWDQREAIRLMADADSLVEQLGVSGTCPEIAAAAAAVAGAYTTRNAEALRSAVKEFTVLVRSLGSGLFRPATAGDDSHLPT